MATVTGAGSPGRKRKLHDVTPLDEAGPKPRRKRSPAWAYFLPLVPKESAKCQLCDQEVKAKGGCTSGLVRHLQSKHRESTRNVEGLEVRRKAKAVDVGPGPQFRGRVIPLDKTGPQPCRQLTSPMWNFFTPIVFRKTAKCLICSHQVGIKGGCTTGLLKHMRARHPGRLGGLRKKMVLKGQDDTITGPSSVVKIEPGADQRDGNSGEGEMEQVPEDQKDYPMVDDKLDSPQGNIITGDHPGGRRKSRRLTSSTWQFFVPVAFKEMAKCTLCGVVLRTTSGNTSSMGRHLKAKHGRDVKARRREMFLARQKNSARESRPKVIVKIDLDADDHVHEQGENPGFENENEVKGKSEAKQVEADIHTEDGNRGSGWSDASRLRKRTRKEKLREELDSDISDGDDPEETEEVPMGEGESSDEDFRMDDPLLQSDQEEDETAPRSKINVKPSSTSGKARSARETLIDKETCFVCHAKFSSSKVPQFSEKEYRFFFKEMLEIPTRKALNYLEELEDPDKWIALCHSCQSLIGESLSARRKIRNLELQIEKCQRIVLKKLKVNSGKDVRNCPGKQWQAIKGIKEFVQLKDYSVLDPEEGLDKGVRFSSPIYQLDDETDDPEPEPHSPQALYCGLCADDTIYETAAQLTAHTKEAHTTAFIETEADEDTLEDPASKPVTGHSYHHYQYRYDCPNCPQVKDYTVTQFVQHLAIHRRRPYQCTICSAFLPEDPDLQEHHWKENHLDIELPPSTDKYVQIKFSPGKIWNCESCLAGFFSEDARDRHELGCVSPAKLEKRKSLPLTKSKPHICQLCDGLRFRDFAEWRFHRALHHPEVDSMSCYYCDESFRETTLDGVEARHDQKMVDHMQSEHESMKFFPECEPCGLVFEPGMEITKHMHAKHGTPANKVYTCSFCDVSYGDPRGIRRHMAHVHFERHSWICETCGAKFLQDVALNHHNFRVHGLVPEGQEVLHCQQEGCGFKTISLGKLNVHMVMVHEAQGRPFVCSSCGKGFTTKSYLKLHEDSHKNRETKPFRCETCGASFAVKYYLNVHRKLQHEGKKTGRRKRSQNNPETVVAGVGTSASSETPAPSASFSTELSQPT